MADKATTPAKQVADAKALGRCAEAARATASSAHAAAGLALVRSKEAARLLRISESSARAAAAVLGEAESVLRAAAQSASSSAVVTPATASSTRSARRRARKKEVKAKVLNGEDEVWPHMDNVGEVDSTVGDADVPLVHRQEKKACAPRERSLRRTHGHPHLQTPSPQSRDGMDLESTGFSPGDIVMINGLTKRVDLNGKRAKVMGYDRASGRIIVSVEDLKDCVRLRPELLSTTLFTGNFRGGGIPAETKA